MCFKAGEMEERLSVPEGWKEEKGLWAWNGDYNDLKNSCEYGVPLGSAVWARSIPRLPANPCPFVGSMGLAAGCAYPRKTWQSVRVYWWRLVKPLRCPMRWRGWS